MTYPELSLILEIVLLSICAVAQPAPLLKYILMWVLL